MKKLLSAFLVSFLVFSSVSFAVTPVSAGLPDTPNSASARTLVQQESININTADAQALTKLKGVGPKKAEAIILWRKANGGFKTIEQFTEVKGIGAATLEKNRKSIRLQ